MSKVILAVDDDPEIRNILVMTFESAGYTVHTAPDGRAALELLEKLAALVPPPRFNLVRYHGVLAPEERHRDPRPRNYSWAELMR